MAERMAKGGLEVKNMAATVASVLALALLATHCPADPPKPQIPPKTFVYAPVPKPVNGILQYGQAPDGKLTPLKPPLVSLHNPDVYVSATDPEGHFLYFGSSPLRQFRISRNGQLVPLKPATSPCRRQMPWRSPRTDASFT